MSDWVSNEDTQLKHTQIQETAFTFLKESHRCKYISNNTFQYHAYNT